MKIALCLDNNYVPHCATVIMSVIAHNQKENISFHILSSDISSTNIAKLTQWVNSFPNKQIFIYTINIEQFKHLPIGKAYINISTYFRLLLPNYLKDIEKVIYLDCDVIVKGSLKELWDTDISHYAMAGVRDRINDYIRVYNRLEYDMHYGYINAGVLLINLKFWKEKDIFKQASEIALRMPLQLKNHDQDILNLIFHRHMLFIDFKYNVLEYFFYNENHLFLNKKYYSEIESALKSPLIIHYCMPNKPWHKECINPYKNDYARYRQSTPWKDFKISRRNYLSLKERLLQAAKFIAAQIGLTDKNTKENPIRKDIYKIEDKLNVIF